MNLIPTLIEFVKRADSGLDLDGFLIEIADPQFGHSLESFAPCVRQVLTTISRSDPSGLSCMDLKSIGSSSWYFSFLSVPLFVTTFAPYYPPTSSRYMGYPSSSSSVCQSCFILLQPEISFLRHGLGPDSPLTHWTGNPQCRDTSSHEFMSLRCRIRASFRDRGQGYSIPSTLSYPVSQTFVAPLRDNPFPFPPAYLPSLPSSTPTPLSSLSPDPSFSPSSSVLFWREDLFPTTLSISSIER